MWFLNRWVFASTIIVLTCWSKAKGLFIWHDVRRRECLSIPIANRQFVQTGTHLSLFACICVWQEQVSNTRFKCPKKSAGKRIHLEKDWIFFFAPKSGTHPVISPAPNADRQWTHVSSAAAEPICYWVEHTLDIVAGRLKEADYEGLKRIYRVSLSRCWSRDDCVASLVLANVPFSVNQMKSLDGMAQAKLAKFLHADRVAQKVSELGRQEARDILAGISRNQLVNHPGGDHAACHCVFVGNHDILNLVGRRVEHLNTPPHCCASDEPH